MSEKPRERYEFITYVTKVNILTIHKGNCTRARWYKGEWTGYDSVDEAPKNAWRCQGCMRSSIWKELGFK